MNPRSTSQFWKVIRFLITDYLTVSLVFSSTLTAFAQEAPSETPSESPVESSSQSAPSLELSALEAALSSPQTQTEDPVSESDYSAQSAAEESGSGASPAEPEEESLPPGEPESGSPPPEESMMSSQSITTSSGNSDGTPNTIKQLLPDVDKMTGALVYQFPIKTPPGRNGIEPGLGLTYNSFSTNADSIFGYGWDSNIPYIRRLNKKGVTSLYADSYFESSMSGELVASSSIYQARVENGDFLKYEFASSTWTVSDKLGKVFSFGNSTSTRQYDPDSGKIYAWMLSEVRDLNGNYMTYEYFQNQGQIYPSKIYYTQYGTSTTPFEVEFVREGRSDIIPKFNASYNVTTAYRIKEILAKFNSSNVRKYALNYASSTTNVRIVLDNVIETGYGSSTVTLPATDFTYQGTWGVFETDTNPACPSTSVDTGKGVMVVDVNADALPDIVQSTNSASSTYINNGNSTWTANSLFTSPLMFWDSNSSTTSDLGVRIADINGDGRVDLLKKTTTGTSTVYFNTASGWSLHTSTSTWQIPKDFTDSFGTDLNVRILDVNGDGLPDIIHQDSSGNPQASVYINNGTGWASDSGWSFPVDNFKDGVIFADLNNDGLMDIMKSQQIGGGTWNRGAYFNYGNKTFSASGTADLIPPVVFNNGSDHGVREADVDGDGYSDLIQAKYGVSQAIYRNTGTGWASSTGWTPGWNFIDINGVDTGVRLADYDGSGIVDALDCNDVPGGGTDYFWKNPAIRNDLLKVIKNQFGGSTSVTYKTTPSFKNGSTLLNPNLPFLLDAVEIVAQGDGASPTSTKTFTYEGGKQYFADAYDRKMAGFAKVTSTDSASNTTAFFFHQGDTSSSTIGEYNDHFSKIGKIYRIERANSAASIFDKVINKWDYSTSTSASSSFVSLIQSVSLTYDGDSDHKDKAESYAYNTTSTGNIVQKNEWGEVTGSDDGTFTDTASDIRITDVTYASNTASYILGLPATEIVTNASSTKVKESRYYYDSGALGTASIGNLTKEERWKSSSNYIDIEKTYNGYGLVTQQKDPRDKATNFTYDAWNLYVATSTNPLSQSTTYVYDYPSGQVALRRDPNSLLFQSVYDGVGRITEEKQPNLNATSTLVTKTSVSYTDTYNSSNVLRTNYLNAASTTLSYTYLDGFGRPVQSRTQAEDSNIFVVADTAYNNRQRIEKESLPYFSTGASSTTATATTTLLVQYTYDPILRVASTTNAVGAVSKHYDDWKTTVTDLRGKVKHFYNDAYGNLNRVDELNSGSTYTTTYEYDLNDNLIKITDASSNIRNFTYDGLSRRLTAQDLHGGADATFGTWTYTYDDTGNVTQTVDPSSQTVNYAYDDLSRALTEDYTGASSTEQGYSYDFCLLGKGRLCEASSTQNIITQFLYNGLGGIARETKTVSSTAYQTDYVYDRLGNAVMVTNPDSSIVTNVYNAAGRLEAVFNKESGVATTTIISSIDYAPTGKPTVTAYGNGLTTTNTYDAANLYRLTHKITTLSTSNPSGPAELYTTSLYSDGNLVAYYRLEGNSNDSKGSNNGSDTSISYSSSNGKFGQGAGFGGSSKIDLSSLPVNSQNVTISIVFWAKTSSTSRQRFMDMGSCDINKDCIQPEIYNSGTVIGDFAAYSGVSSATGVTDNTWHHFAYTVDGGATYKLYIDGSLADTKSTTGLRITNSGTNTKRIGQSYLDSTGFGGAMDDVAFFNRVLTANEISGLYNGF